MVDSVYRTRSLGIGVSGIPDQYADGKAAKVWQHYIGGHKKRTESYREFFCNLLNDNGVKHILDVACGTGWENDPQFIAQIWQWTRHEIETHLKNVVFDNCVLLKMHIFTFFIDFYKSANSTQSDLLWWNVCALFDSVFETYFVDYYCALRISLSYDTSISLGSRFAKILSGFFLVWEWLGRD